MCRRKKAEKWLNSRVSGKVVEEVTLLSDIPELPSKTARDKPRAVSVLKTSSILFDTIPA